MPWLWVLVACGTEPTPSAPTPGADERAGGVSSIAPPAAERAQRTLVLTGVTPGAEPAVRWMLTAPDGTQVGLDGSGQLLATTGAVADYHNEPRPCGPAPDCQATATRSAIAQPPAGQYKLEIVGQGARRVPVEVRIEATDVRSQTESSVDVSAELMGTGAQRTVYFELRFEPRTDLRLTTGPR